MQSIFDSTSDTSSRLLLLLVSLVLSNQCQGLKCTWHVSSNLNTDCTSCRFPHNRSRKQLKRLSITLLGEYDSNIIMACAFRCVLTISVNRLSVAEQETAGIMNSWDQYWIINWRLILIVSHQSHRHCQLQLIVLEAVSELLRCHMTGTIIYLWSPPLRLEEVQLIIYDANWSQSNAMWRLLFTYCLFLQLVVCFIR